MNALDRRNRLIAMAVSAALPLVALSLPASAQTRVNQDGRAMDASNRVGSSGYNDAATDRRGQTYTGNQLVTGNVSGARAFRGPLGYRDVNEFTGPSAGLQTDRFIRDSAGAPTRSNPMLDYGRPTAFYGDDRSTPLPLGYRAEGFTGTYYNTGGAQTTVGTPSPYLQSTSQVFMTQTSMLRPGGLVLDAGADRQNRQTLLSVSPLYGVVPLNPGPLGDANDNSMLSRTDTLNPRNPTDRFRLDPADLDRMRRELREADQGESRPAEESTEPANPQELKSQPLDSALNTNQLGTGAGADRFSGGNTQTNQGLDRRLMVAPEKQSKQYAELQKRLQRQQQSGDLTPEEANREFRQLKKAQEGGDAKAADPGADKARPRTVLPPTRREAPAPDAPAPAAPAVPPAPVAPAAPAVERPAPLKIKSLAEGVEAKGLRDLLAEGEKLLREGQFKSAIEKYIAAEQVAPNNPLIRLGRAQAELAATRYGSAEQHLREAFAADPALLLGQYDLDAFLGRDRLSFLVKDLKQVAASEATSPRPHLLLAYIAYNTPGTESATAEYLKEAEARSRQPDPLIAAMRKHWVIPSAPAASEPNK